jgi:hypothetical protein
MADWRDSEPRLASNTRTGGLTLSAHDNRGSCGPEDDPRTRRGGVGQEHLSQGGNKSKTGVGRGKET